MIPAAGKPKLDIKSFAATMNLIYEQTVSQYCNFLLYGDIGTGKTMALKTARLPLVVSSFDPGGLSVIDDMLSRGEAIFDSSPEHEAKGPTELTAYEKFSLGFDRMKAAGVFENCGTYAIDSLTSMAESIMTWILKKGGRWGTTPQKQDYYTLQNILSMVIRECCTLPCDFILIGHMGSDRDDLTGQLISSLFVAGKNSVRVPTYFDQVLVTLCKSENKVPKYYFLCNNDGVYKAKMRLAAHAKFELLEEPNIKKLRAKAGKSCEDLPLFK
jgi:hypothetical protein